MGELKRSESGIDPGKQCAVAAEQLTAGVDLQPEQGRGVLLVKLIMDLAAPLIGPGCQPFDRLDRIRGLRFMPELWQVNAQPEQESSCTAGACRCGRRGISEFRR